MLLVSGCAVSRPEIKPWNPYHLRLIETLVGGEPHLYSADFSPDGRLLAVSRSDGCIRIYSTASWEETRRLQTCQGSPRGIDFSPDSSRLALGAYKEIHIFDTKTWSRTRVLVGHEADVYRLAWSPNGSRLASSGGDGTARIWNPESGAELVTCKGHQGYVMGLAWMPNGEQLVTSSYDRAIIVWDANSGIEQKRRADGAVEYSGLEIAPDGRAMVVSGGFNVIYWDADQPKWPRQGAEPAQALFAPDGRHLVVSYGRDVIIISPKGEVTATLSGHVDRYICALAVSRHGYIASLGHDRRICIWGPR